MGLSRPRSTLGNSERLSKDLANEGIPVNGALGAIVVGDTEFGKFANVNNLRTRRAFSTSAVLFSRCTRLAAWDVKETFV